MMHSKSTPRPPLKHGAAKHAKPLKKQTRELVHCHRYLRRGQSLGAQGI